MVTSNKPPNLPIIKLDLSYVPPNVQTTLDYCGNTWIASCIHSNNNVATCNTYTPYAAPMFEELNSMTDDQQISYLALNGLNYITFLDNPSERVQMLVVEFDIMLYDCIRNPCESVTHYVNSKKKEMLEKMIKDIEQW